MRPLLRRIEKDGNRKKLTFTFPGSEEQWHAFHDPLLTEISWLRQGAVLLKPAQIQSAYQIEFAKDDADATVSWEFKPRITPITVDNDISLAISNVLEKMDFPLEFPSSNPKRR